MILIFLFLFLDSYNLLEVKTIETRIVTFLSHIILASAGVKKDDCVHTRLTHALIM